jgi:L-arabinonolactonase
VTAVPAITCARKAQEGDEDVDIDIVVDVKTLLGEGPLWDTDQQRLYFVDSMGQRIFRMTQEGRELRSWLVPAPIGSMALTRDGPGAILALANGVHDLDFATGRVRLIADPEEGRPLNRLNDGKVDRRGRFVFGSMDTSEEDRNGRLYRLDPDYTLSVLDHKLICSNGPCWAPDDATFYFSDTWSGEIWAYDYDIQTGTPSNRRHFATIDRPPVGGFDGSTVDAEGYLWNALVYDGKLVRYAPDGSVDRVIDMPVKKVTSVMFGGADLDILYVTTMARPPLERFPDDPVEGGSLYAVTGLGVTGVPEPRFGGELRA